MKVLNIGAGGFIGAHLTEGLLARGYTVTGIDTHTDKLAEFLDHSRLQFINTDIRRPDFDLDRLVGEADLVVDLVAYANPGIYVRQPLDVFYLNFSENLKIAETCVRRGKRLIQFSSCEVYGKTPAGLWPDSLIDPEDPSWATFTEDSSPFVLGPVNKHRWIYACAK
ncbi:MAG: NAD-dependent epimerase/dehydratase family protein, partial [Pseudomonadota bacterium]